MSRKILTLFALLFSSSCVFDPISYVLGGDGVIQLDEPIVMRPTKWPEENKGNLLALDITSYNYSKKRFEETNRCPKQVNFIVTYYTPIKATFERKHLQAGNPEFQFVEKGATNGRFKIKKSDIYILYNKQKIYPKTISSGGVKSYQEYDSFESSFVAYSNYKRYGPQYLRFDLAPCTKLLDPNTKLIIERIYKDDKVIKENIEFGFVKSGLNKTYRIWLE